MDTKEYIRQELERRMGNNKSARDELKKLVGEQREIAMMDPEYRTDYTPRAALIDELTGSDLARKMNRPESTQDALRKALDYKMRVPQESISGLPQALASAAKAGGRKSLSGEQMKRLGSARVAAQALADVEGALNKGSSILPEFITGATGDSEFTEAARRFAEGFGRMQSGAAITSDEETRFKRLLPRFSDSEEIRAIKLNRLRQEIEARMGEIGGEMPQTTPMGGNTADSFDFANMTDEQLKQIAKGN